MADADVLIIEEDEGSSYYLSIQDAAVALGVKSSAIRRAIVDGDITTQRHPWGVRVKRDDIAMLAQAIANQPPRYGTALLRTRVPRKPQRGSVIEGADDQLDQHVLAVVSETGPITLAQLHEAMQSRYGAAFPSLVYSTRRLVANGMLRRRKEGKGDVYELQRLPLVVRDFLHSQFYILNPLIWAKWCRCQYPEATWVTSI